MSVLTTLILTPAVILSSETPAYKHHDVLNLCQSFSGAFGRHSWSSISLDVTGAVLYLKTGNNLPLNCDIEIEARPGRV